VRRSGVVVTSLRDSSFRCHSCGSEKPAQRLYRQRIIFLRSSTKDKIKGNLREAKGKVKEESGKANGNPNLQDRGAGEKVAGKVQKKIGDVKKVFGK
jgi:uncharacterized protein YjbJ (UPF0337 family)